MVRISKRHTPHSGRRGFSTCLQEVDEVLGGLLPVDEELFQLAQLPQLTLVDLARDVL